MAELIVVGFDGTGRAAQVLDQLEMLDSIWAIELKDGIAVYRTDDGQLRVNRSLNPTTKEEAIRGGLLGALVGGVVLAPFAAMIAIPAAAATVGLSGAALGAAGGAAESYDEAKFRETYGISEDFVKQVGGMVQPGQSALFVLVQASDPKAIKEQFRGYGGKVLRTTLKPEQTKNLEATLAD
jgi:uncharacterized membrane protein